jgi:hypothetical protein
MNLLDTLEVYAGGPGSGCQGPNCGRPGHKEWRELMDEHNRIKGHRLRKGDQEDRQYRMQRIVLPALADRIESTFGQVFSKSGGAMSDLKNSRKWLDKAEATYAKGEVLKAVMYQEDALVDLHDSLRQIKNWKYGKSFS